MAGFSGSRPYVHPAREHTAAPRRVGRIATGPAPAVARSTHRPRRRCRLTARRAGSWTSSGRGRSTSGAGTQLHARAQAVSRAMQQSSGRAHSLRSQAVPVNPGAHMHSLVSLRRVSAPPPAQPPRPRSCTHRSHSPRLEHSAGWCAVSVAMGRSNQAPPDGHEPAAHTHHAARHRRRRRRGHARREQSPPIHPSSHVHTYLRAGGGGHGHLPQRGGALRARGCEVRVAVAHAVPGAL